MYIGLHVKYRYSSQMLVKLEFSRQIFREKKTPVSNSMKIRPERADLFHADARKKRQTDRLDEANSRFSQFYERA